MDSPPVCSFDCVPSRDQSECLLAMHKAANETKESFICRFPQNSGTTTMIAMHLANQLKLGLAPRRILVIVSTKRDMTFGMKTLHVLTRALPVTKCVMGFRRSCMQPKARAELMQVLLDGLPRFSADIVGLVAQFCDHGFCEIDYRPSAVVGRGEPKRDLVICELIQSASMPYFASMRREGAQMFLFFKEYPLIQPKGLNLPELAISSTPNWSRRQDERSMRLAPNVLGCQEAKARLEANAYDDEYDECRKLLKCSA